MSPRLKSLLTLLAVLAVVGLWSLESARDLPRERPSLAPLQPAPRFPPPPVLTPPVIPFGVKGVRRVLKAGLTHRYRFDLDTRTAEQLPGAEAGRTWRHSGWSGEVAVTWAGTEGGQHFFVARVKPTWVEDAEPLVDGALRDFRASFERPVYVTQDERGQVVAVHFDLSVGERARRFIRRLVAATQFVAEEGRAWTTQEEDTTGDFEAEYRAGGSAHTYVKTKRRYLRTAVPVWAPSGAGGPGLVVPRPRGHWDFTLDEDGLVREVTGSDVVESGGGATGLPLVRTETRVAMTHLGSEQRAVSTLKDFHAARARWSAEVLSSPETSRALSTESGEQPSSELLQTLARAVSKTNPPSPEQAHALAQAMTTMVGRVERPSFELARALARAVGTTTEPALRDAVGLALGTVVRGLERSEPARAVELLDGLLRRCEARRLDARECLHVLARTGSSRGRDYARRSLADTSPEVRAAATRALGAMKGASIEALLDEVILTDKDAGVREQAATLMAQRVSGPHLRTVAQCLRTEPEPRVRAELVRMLGQVLTVEPLATELLRDVAARDDAEDLRRLASSLLAKEQE
ncbi:HEAT repeat domain-containing protein [Myxococcus sp. K38C18041901]|uniref:HEAT repeat domain-containing protein n=1 Tax=Myxococcus guangdongensis TaxID=2906760 RepID=UPI0020A8020E|nr:HEAT repeat domain-containing protein [Myxococcus guangdongensis]MCP3063430.1 HEAT repeat domain-containing protein [Myxococcus guangdongensis]